MFYLDKEIINNIFDSMKVVDNPSGDDIMYVKTDSGIDLYIDIPGVNKEDISIKTENSLIRLDLVRFYGVKKVEYTKTFSINKKFDLNTIEADLKNGVLTLHIKEKELEPLKEIPIKIL